MLRSAWKDCEMANKTTQQLHKVASHALTTTNSNKWYLLETSFPSNLDLNNVDHVSSNVRSSRFGVMLNVFENNEAVIKKIIKGRSPTMRHVSRTHRVALDWLFDRINLDSEIEFDTLIPNINSQTC